MLNKENELDKTKIDSLKRMMEIVLEELNDKTSN